MIIIKTKKECFGAFTNLYEKKDQSQKRDLKNKLWNLNIERDDTVASFFTNISQVIDRLDSIGVVTDENYILQTIIDGLSSAWETFLDVVNE